jgi:hypothetical protein
MADTDIDAVRKQKKAEYDKQYRLKRKFLLQQQAFKDIHDPVLSSLKMEGIRLSFLCAVVSIPRNVELAYGTRVAL